MANDRPENDAEDRWIVEALRTGDDRERAFRALFSRYRRRLLAFFASRGLDPETCADLSQETFVRVYRSSARFRGEAPLAVWIFRIAANLYRNEIRRRHAAKRQATELSLIDDRDTAIDHVQMDTGAAGDAEPLAGALRQERSQALRHAVADLPPQMRRVFELRAYHGFETRDIAAVLKISPSTVKVHLHQARKRLADQMTMRFSETPF